MGWQKVFGGDRTNGLTTTAGRVFGQFWQIKSGTGKTKWQMDLWDPSAEMHSVKPVWLGSDRRGSLLFRLHALVFSPIASFPND
jgi:hypothetical protein